MPRRARKIQQGRGVHRVACRASHAPPGRGRVMHYFERKYLTWRDREEIGTKCANCGDEQDLVYHHIVPLALGGNDINTNMVCLCGRCHDLVHYGKSAEISHTEAVKRGIEKAKTAGVHFGKKAADYEHIMEMIANHSTQFNPLSWMTEHEVCEMLRIGYTTYCKCKRKLIDDINAEKWEHGFEKPKILQKRATYDRVIKKARGY